MTVATESGPVQGTVEDGIAAYRGIPYAASPVGDRRFAAPVPHPGWADLRDASRSGPSVPQGPSRLEAVMGHREPDWDEDGSLNLNVWSPAGAAARPVLVWFHGGGFTSGSGGWEWYDGRNLAAAGDIVVVTANYRIGPLGYLYLPELGVDNLGVRDQAAVLAWVHRNIAAFGGDPGNVTVGGQSAGAFSAVYLALSAESGPYVKRVIAESGPFGLAPQNPVEAALHARRYLDLLGVEDIAGLRAVPADRLLAAYRQLAQELSRPGNVAPPMYPVLGGFGMPATWQQGLAEGRLAGKAVLAGTARDEMTAFFAFDPRIQALTVEGARAIAEGSDRLTDRRPDAASAELIDHAAARPSDARPADQNPAERFDHAAAKRPDATPAEILTAVETELVFRDGTLAIAEAAATAYVYQFDYGPSHLGATHCAELPFVFDTVDAYRGSPLIGDPISAAHLLGHVFSRAVATFVATGRPAFDGWKPFDPADHSTVQHFA
jgi:para-nitrobenzyl esterase